MLTQELLKSLLHYDPDTGIFTWLMRPEINRDTRRWNSRHAGTNAGYLVHGYLTIRFCGTAYHAQRLAWLYMTGSLPVNIIDHIDTDVSNNRFANLREATDSENACNHKRNINNTTGFKGVIWRKDRGNFQARIMRHRKSHSLGFYDTPEAAHKAYCEAADRLHGEFARTA